MSRMMRHSEFLERISSRSDISDYEIISKYKGVNHNIEIKHVKCGRIFEMRAGNFLYGKQGCSLCNSNFNKITFKDLILESEKMNLEVLSEEYKNIKSPITVKCNKCGYVFETNLDSIKHKKNGCPECAGNRKFSPDEIQAKIQEDPMYYVEKIENYENVHSLIKIKHLNCGLLFDMSYNNFRNGQRCPKCSKRKSSGGMSHAMREIIDYLIIEKIKFEREKTFPRLKNKRSLRYDLFLPELNLIIEYHGKQHRKYESNGYFNKEKVTKIQQRDKLKKDYILSETSHNFEVITDQENHIERIKEIILKYK